MTTTTAKKTAESRKAAASALKPKAFKRVGIASALKPKAFKRVAMYGATSDVRPVRGKLPVKVDGFRALLRTAPMSERVRIEREGVPYQIVKGLIDEIGVSSTDFQRFIRIPKATFIKKMKEKTLFAGTSGQSVIGLMELINKVEDMLAAERENPEARGFDVEKWVGDWIQRPQPALGGLKPAELIDTPTGRDSVMRVLGSIQSGAYQ